MLHLHDHRRATGDKSAAGLGPQPRVRQAEALEACLDFREVCAERRHLDVRITHRKTTADIDHLDRHAGIADHLADQSQRSAPGERLEALRTDMEAQPETRRMRACRAQQLRRRRRLCAELARQIQHRRPLRHGKADDQAKLTGNTVAAVSCRIFASSSVLSSTKSRTPCRCHASRMAPRDLTGCMKWIEASGNI